VVRVVVGFCPLTAAALPVHHPALIDVLLVILPEPIEELAIVVAHGAEHSVADAFGDGVLRLIPNDARGASGTGLAPIFLPPGPGRREMIIADRCGANPVRITAARRAACSARRATVSTRRPAASVPAASGRRSAGPITAGARSEEHTS